MEAGASMNGNIALMSHDATQFLVRRTKANYYTLPWSRTGLLLPCTMVGCP